MEGSQSRCGRNGEEKNLVGLLIARCAAFRGQFSKANLHGVVIAYLGNIRTFRNMLFVL